VRPLNLRFEESFSLFGRKGEHRFIAWKRGDLEKVWPPPLPSTSEQATAASLSSAFPRNAHRFVLGLLMPDIFRDGLNALTSVTRLAEDSVDGRATFRIYGMLGGLPTNVWIDRQTLLVLKVEQRTESEGLVIVSTTTFKPQSNVSVAPERLAFGGPIVPAPIIGPANVEVVSFSWSKHEQESYFVVPAPSDMDASLPSVGQVPLRNSPSSAQSPVGHIPPRWRTVYLYQLQIKNHGTKAIAAVAWDYVVMDLANNRELGRQHLTSDEKVKAGATASLRARSYSAPSKTVSAESAKPGQQDAAPERAEVRCVLFADGSWWKDPAARENECEYFKSMADRSKN
jgi:hypothetical protein